MGGLTPWTRTKLAPEARLAHQACVSNLTLSLCHHLSKSAYEIIFDTCIHTTQVSLLNFTITLSGLEDQLLIAVLSQELPELATAKEALALRYLNSSVCALVSSTLIPTPICTPISEPMIAPKGTVCSKNIALLLV